ncbi:hypothetical protein QBC40DRAFT_290321 [Triangularia verruculosa]|uniref:Uncharacterized protein n=1 Tax=Triangularia verruculosa TaxID=2587418 RepID=A0AAN6X6P9_9PEZI|nr:hypothetical protein QBC40DRAFT_290321 [Triangularia verruculosa]
MLTSPTLTHTFSCLSHSLCSQGHKCPSLPSPSNSPFLSFYNIFPSSPLPSSQPRPQPLCALVSHMLGTSVIYIHTFQNTDSSLNIFFSLFCLSFTTLTTLPPYLHHHLAHLPWSSTPPAIKPPPTQVALHQFAEARGAKQHAQRCCPRGRSATATTAQLHSCTTLLPSVSCTCSADTFVPSVLPTAELPRHSARRRRPTEMCRNMRAGHMEAAASS